MRSTTLTLAILLLSSFPQTAAVADSAAAPSGPVVDCGVSTLYYLLRLEGRSASLEMLARSLPPRDAAGRSMKELRDEARKRGVALRGVKLRAGERPEGPSIVFFGDGGHGHYVVARPVGHSGKLVQVLDPNEPPEVMDFYEFEARPRWTGLALVPDPPSWPRRIGVTLAGFGIAGLAMIGWRRRPRSAKIV